MIKSVHLRVSLAKPEDLTPAQREILADAAALSELAREIRGRANRLSGYRRHLPEAVAIGWIGHAIWKAEFLASRARADGGILEEHDLPGVEATSALVLRPIARVIDLAPHLARRGPPR